jgi:outer membrane lipoprotein
MFGKQFIVAAIIILLTGCASTPVFDTSEVNTALTPKLALEESVENLGRIVLWGGTILDIRNLKDATHVEILAYPLDSAHSPDLDEQPIGRFIVHNQDFLDPASFSQGQSISVLGEVGESQDATIGESSYLYPVIRAQQVHLWPKKKNNTRSNFSFGIGISL